MSKLDYPLSFHPSLPLGEEMNVTEIPVDTGLIQCICESTEDDGFTIQCDRCLTWQHAYCMNINQNNIPDRYLCDNCVKRISSTTHALRNGNNKDTQRSISKFNNHGSTDSELDNSNKPTSIAKRKEEKLKPNGNSRSFPNKSNTHNKRSRELPSLDDYSSVGSNSSSNGKDGSILAGGTGKSTATTTTTTVKKPKLSKRISVSKRSLPRNMMMMVDSEQNLMTKATTKLHSKKKDKYQPTNFNTVKSKFVYEVIKETRDRWKQSPKWKSQPWRAAASGQQPMDSGSAAQQSNNKKLQNGPFTVMDTLSLQQSSSTNIAIRSLPKQQQHHHHHHHHHQQQHRSSYKLRKGAFADTPLNANTFLLEAHGEMVLKSEYKFDATNDYSLLGTSCAHVLFYPTVDLCIDGRRLGNDTRYFRRSCHPNAELRTIVFSQQKKRTHLSTTGIDGDGDEDWHKDGSLIRLGIFTRVPIEQGEEITLGWNWQKGHISWRKNVEWYRSSSSEHEHHQNRTLAHVKSDPMVEDTGMPGDVDLIGTDGDNTTDILRDGTGDNEESDRYTRYAIQQMLDRFDVEFGDCACSEHDVCLIERLRQERDMLSSSPVILNGRIETTASTKPTAKTSHTSSLQHSRQIIVAPNTASPGSKSDNEKLATGYSPAAGSVEENVDIDVISMSPGTMSAPSPANHTTHVLDQVKKEANSDVDDELDIDGDIDIGDDDIPGLSTKISDSTALMSAVANENKLGSVDSIGGGQQQHYGSSFSSTSSLSGTDSDANGDIIDGKNKDQHAFKKQKQDSATPSTKTTSVSANKTSALPCKKVWMRHFLRHNVKTENVVDASSDVDAQKSPVIDGTGDNHGDEMDVTGNHGSTDTEIHDNVDDKSAMESTIIETNTTTVTDNHTAMDMDLDEGELSDASSASTIPLDEDDRDWTLRTRQPQSPEQLMDEGGATATASTQQPVIGEVKLSMDTTSIDTVSATVVPPQETTPKEEDSIATITKEDETASLSANPPPPSTEQDEVVKSEQQQQQLNETTNTTGGMNDDGKEAQQEGSDQAKPTKVKVSLQEYLSRRMASKDTPKPAAPNN